MSRDTQATIVTLLLMLVSAVLLDAKMLLPRGGFPAGTFFFIILWGPISFLLWRKENIRDYDAKQLFGYCRAGITASLGMGIWFAIELILNGSRWLEQKIEINGAWSVFAIFLVVAAIFAIFVALSFLRLGVKTLLNWVFTSKNEKDLKSNKMV